MTLFTLCCSFSDLPTSGTWHGELFIVCPRLARKLMSSLVHNFVFQMKFLTSYNFNKIFSSYSFNKARIICNIQIHPQIISNLVNALRKHPRQSRQQDIYAHNNECHKFWIVNWICINLSAFGGSQSWFLFISIARHKTLFERIPVPFTFLFRFAFFSFLFSESTLRVQIEMRTIIGFEFQTTTHKEWVFVTFTSTWLRGLKEVRE